MGEIRERERESNKFNRKLERGEKEREREVILHCCLDNPKHIVWYDFRWRGFFYFYYLLFNE